MQYTGDAGSVADAGVGGDDATHDGGGGVDIAAGFDAGGDGGRVVVQVRRGGHRVKGTVSWAVTRDPLPSSHAASPTPLPNSRRACVNTALDLTIEQVRLDPVE
jgi:hypothetical protein